jgi:hypothetical protein
MKVGILGSFADLSEVFNCGLKINLPLLKDPRKSSFLPVPTKKEKFSLPKASFSEKTVLSPFPLL